MTMDRREFIRKAAIASGIVAVGPYTGFAAANAQPGSSDGYGRLLPTADELDGKIRLDLPRGFQYRSFHHAGTQFESGGTVPGRGDGMAAFDGPRRNVYTLIRNHEVNGPVGAFGDLNKAYDPLTGGGTVTVEVDRHGKVQDDWVSLNGTQMNCAGGKTPWGSWISCEETVNGGDVGADFTGQSNDGLKKHGYLFEVPLDSPSTGEPIRAAGRFAHEAVAVDPDTGHLYMTEDNFLFASGFFRYTAPVNPVHTGSLADGGVLEMLKVVGINEADLSLEQPDGVTFACEWVPIADPDPTFAEGTTNNQAIVAVGNQGRANGAAIFSRLEGCIYSDGLIFFCSTQGGPTVMPDNPPSGFGDGRGQIWAYDPQTSQLSLVFQSPGSATLDLPDNVTSSSSGTLVICEDGKGDNFIRGLTTDGALFDFARNADSDEIGQEFAGATFSPDYKTLFVNIQSNSGYSMAIWGPWARGPF